MKKIIAGVLVCLSLTACSKTEKDAGIGAASGAIIGGLASGTWEGAAVGAAAGGAGGAILGNASERNNRDRQNRWDRRDRRDYDCRYRDRYRRCHGRGGLTGRSERRSEVPDGNQPSGTILAKTRCLRRRGLAAIW